VGNFHRPFASRLEVFEPLRRHDPDALRITEFPGYSGMAWAAELHPKPKYPAQAIARIAFFDARHGGDGGWQWLNLSRREYDALAARVDDAMAESRLPPAKGGQLVVCADSGEYVVERRKRRATSWFKQECPDDGLAGELIEQLVETAPFPLCWYVSFRVPADGLADPCEAVGSPGVHCEAADAGPTGAEPAP
jgi:hypothetical protein